MRVLRYPSVYLRLPLGVFSTRYGRGTSRLVCAASARQVAAPSALAVSVLEAISSHRTMLATVFRGERGDVLADRAGHQVGRKRSVGVSLDSVPAPVGHVRPGEQECGPA